MAEVEVARMFIYQCDAASLCVTEAVNIGTGRIEIEVRYIINGWETNHIAGKPANHLSIQKRNIF